MRSSPAQTPTPNDRILLVDDTDENATELLTVICDGDPRTNRGFDFDAYRIGGAA
jgi:hypothetical protein